MKKKKSHEGGLDARALSWPLHCLTGKTACSLTRNSFSAIDLGPRSYARTSPLVIPAFFFLALDLYAAYWFILSTARWSVRPYGPLPSQNMTLPRIIFAPPVVGREAVQRALMAGPGQAVEARNIVSPFMPCQSVACRRPCITRHILVFLPLDTPCSLYAGFDVL
jgi:hypothetical protein